MQNNSPPLLATAPRYQLEHDPGNILLYAVAQTPNSSPLPYRLQNLTSFSLRTNKPFPLSFMSYPHAITVSSSSNFQSIFDNALDKYKKRTKNDLITHPLATQLQSCNSPSAILAILRQEIQDSRSSDERWSRWLDPTVNIIYALSSTVAAGVGLVCLKT